MKDFNYVIEKYLRCKLEPFTAEEFRKHLKSQKIKISLEDAYDILLSADCVFGLVNDLFLTRAGAFTNQIFGFKPKREEVEKGGFIPGHRFMPFLDPAVTPQNATLIFQKKEVPQITVDLNTNDVLDLHALFGEGYIIPMALSDPAGNYIELTKVQYGLPKDLTMTSYSLEPYFEAGFEFGDRILCRVVDWDHLTIETQIQKGNRGTFKMTKEDLEREEWYTTFEEAFLKKLEKCGPTRSIEEQLAFLFLEEQQKLCVEICGSCSEFLEHTSRISFVTYGIESRIWRRGELIPFIGNWNRDILDQRLLPDLSIVFADYVIDSYIKANLYKTGLKGDTEQIFDTIFPKTIKMDDFEHQFAMLHLQKRIDIVKKNYSRFVDYPIASFRNRVLSLFTKISTLMWAVGDSENRLKDLECLPQQELITLTQLLNHTARMLEEMELDSSYAIEEKEDILASLDGMIDTFENIEIPLKQALSYRKHY